FGGRTRVSQRPDISQAIVLGNVVAEVIAQDRDERNPLIVFIGVETRKFGLNSDQFRPTGHFDLLEPQNLRQRRGVGVTVRLAWIRARGPDGYEWGELRSNEQKRKQARPKMPVRTALNPHPDCSDSQQYLAVGDSVLRSPNGGTNRHQITRPHDFQTAIVMPLRALTKYTSL